MGSGIRTILRAAHNRIKRATRTGDYSYWKESGDIDIWPLIYPLRYDILVRGSFFRFYRENRVLYREDINRFTELAMQQPYYVWFTRVMIPRFRPDIANDDTRVRPAYAERLACAAKLYDSIDGQGFDPGHPIIVKTGETILPATSGVMTGAEYYMGDGCHRLACLLALGYDRIPKQWARVKCFRHYQPLDNTSLLRPYMEIDWSVAGSYNPAFIVPGEEAL